MSVKNEEQNIGETVVDRETERGQKSETLEQIAERIASYCPARTDADVAAKRRVAQVALSALRDERKRCAEIADYYAEEDGDVASQAARSIRAE